MASPDPNPIRRRGNLIPTSMPIRSAMMETTILMAVNRCICRQVSFAEALPIARRHGCTSVKELQAYVDIGSGCGLCVPYMQRSLATGEVDLPVLGEVEAAALRNVSGVVGGGLS